MYVIHEYVFHNSNLKLVNLKILVLAIFSKVFYACLMSIKHIVEILIGLFNQLKILSSVDNLVYETS